MKNYFPHPIIFTTLSLPMVLSAQIAPAIEWEKSLGGSGYDEATSISQTTDGGFIIAGWSDSNDGNVSGNHGDNDYWLVKLNMNGYLVWQESLGGTNDDRAYAVQQTDDGGFIVAGLSYSNDGDVSGNHGGDDYWIVKLDSAGNLIWQRSIGGSSLDEAYAIQQIPGEGYIVAGISHSNNGDASGNHGGGDYWVVKLDTLGNLIWEKSLGGSQYDEATSVDQTADGGYIVTGWAKSNDFQVTGNHGNYDYWNVKLDGGGNIEWQKSYGGSTYDQPFSAQQTTDGGYVVAGFTYSDDGNVSGNNGPYDYWVIRLDSAGNLVWQKCLGGTSTDRAYTIQQTSDGGFIVGGYSTSYNGDVSIHLGGSDYWVVKLDSSGNLIWEKSMGGFDDEQITSVQQITDEGFIVAGCSSSFNLEVTGNHGGYDYWIVKLSFDIATDADIPSIKPLSIFPDPVQNFLVVDIPSSFALTGYTIHIFDLEGRMLTLQGSVLSPGQTLKVQINTTSLPEGFYTLQIADPKTGTIEVSKFIRQN